MNESHFLSLLLFFIPIKLIEHLNVKPHHYLCEAAKKQINLVTKFILGSFFSRSEHKLHTESIRSCNGKL